MNYQKLINFLVVNVGRNESQDFFQVTVVPEKLNEAIIGFFVGVICQEGFSHVLKSLDVVLLVVFAHELVANTVVQVDDGLLSWD
jgi:hypothetical protein